MFSGILKNFTRRTLMPVTVCLLISALLSASLASTQKAQKTPDVIILVVAAMDGVTIQYNSIVSNNDAVADLKSLISATGWQARDINIETEGNATSVDFRSAGSIDWQSGGLPVEPFAQTFKRFNLISLNYLSPGNGYVFRSLKDYSDRHVDIDWSSTNATYTYQIKIKDHNFGKLNLPLIVDSANEKSGGNSNLNARSRNGLFFAFLFALAAGAVVVITVSQITRKRKE